MIESLMYAVYGEWYLLACYLAFLSAGFMLARLKYDKSFKRKGDVK